jgi:hypothetical protein
MPTIRISDIGDDGCLAFDLAELLALIGDQAAKSSWVCSVESVVPKTGAKYLDRALVGTHTFPGAVLVQLASNTLQILEGTFRAFRLGEHSPWVTLEAFDTTWWEVSSHDTVLLESISSHFKNVETRASNDG